MTVDAERQERIERAKRLTMARVQAGYRYAVDAAKANGWSLSSYKSHESGDRGIRVPTAQEYANAFGVSVLWLLHGTNTGSIGLAPVIKQLLALVQDFDEQDQRRMLAYAEGIATRQTIPDESLLPAHRARRLAL